MMELSRRFITSFQRGQGCDAHSAPDDGDYVFDVDTCLGGHHLVASLSNLHIQHYDLQIGSLAAHFCAHQDRINSIEMSRSNPFLVLSASCDKTVCLWDLRCQSTGNAPQQRVTLPGEVQSASLGVSDVLVAAASGNSVVFFDLRGGAGKSPVGEYADAHTNVVTQVKFHPENSSHLVSAAEDGLICFFNTAVPEEEEAIVSVLNTDCPVRKFGFFGEGLYCLSTTEIPSFWHVSSAQRLGHFPHARRELGVDYLVDCLYCPATESLTLVAGTYAGQGLLAHVDPNFISLAATLPAGGHKATIRCASLVASSASGVHSFVTGGEDSQLLQWSATSSSTGPSSASSLSSSPGAANGTPSSSSLSPSKMAHVTIKAKTEHSRRAHNPY